MAASSDESRLKLNPAAPEFFPTRRPNPTFRRHVFSLSQPLPFRLPTLPPPHILRPNSYWPSPAGSYLTGPVEFFRSRQQSRCGSNRWMSGGGGQNPPPPRMSLGPRSRMMMESRAADDQVYSRIVEHRDYHPTRLRKEKHKMPLKPGHSTVMICNIPNQYTREMLMEFLDEHCIKENKKLLDNQADDAGSSTRGDDGVISAYDFLYLPFDLSRKLNLGYAFVNFTNPGAVEKFKLACHNKIWEHCGSRKICELAAASMQGKEELMKHFERAGFACEEEEFLPVSFSPPGRGSGMPVCQTTVGILLMKKPSSSSSPLPT